LRRVRIRGADLSKQGQNPFGVKGHVCFGDFKYQHFLPEIAYPAFNVSFIHNNYSLKMNALKKPMHDGIAST